MSSPPHDDDPSTDFLLTGRHGRRLEAESAIDSWRSGGRGFGWIRSIAANYLTTSDRPGSKGLFGRGASVQLARPLNFHPSSVANPANAHVDLQTYGREAWQSYLSWGFRSSGASGGYHDAAFCRASRRTSFSAGCFV